MERAVPPERDPVVHAPRRVGQPAVQRERARQERELKRGRAYPGGHVDAL